MKFLFLLTLVAFVAAKPIEQQHDAPKQSSAGSYNLKINSNGFSKVEQREVGSTVKGKYSYKDEFGKPQTVEYTADRDGFKTTGHLLFTVPIDGNRLVVDTEEGARARALPL